jgi:hypothetical protein
MQTAIQNNLDQPQELEKMYRENKNQFKKAFESLYPEIQETPAAQFWHERLHYETKEIAWGGGKELIFVLILSALAGFLAKFPDLTGIKPEDYYPRNISFIVFPVLSVYFAWKQQLKRLQWFIFAGIVALSAVYINLIPSGNTYDTFILACISLPLVMWSVLGFMFTGPDLMHSSKRIEFLRYNGDLLVMSAVILLAGGLLSAITIGLFELIQIRIEEFYFKNIAIWGLAAIPLIATWLIQMNPQLVKNVSPVIAKVFTPLVLITLFVYLIAIIYTGKDPYNDREFLLIFNLLLIGVMAIILFSVSGTSGNRANLFSTIMLFALSVLTIIVNGIALSAIIFRISEWGITPNRLAVLGGNLLILINLILVAFRLFKSLKQPETLSGVENSIAVYLPVYSAWTIVITFLFPLFFGFK